MPDRIKEVLQENITPFLPKEPIFAFAEGREFMKGYVAGSVVTLACIGLLLLLMGV